jgi:hypothetical protein
MKPRHTPLALLAILALLAAPSLEAAMVAKMGLPQLAHNAAHIFRATVMDVEQSSVALGGGELPVVVYTLRVDETFKGDFGSGKDAMVREVRMLGSIKDQAVTVGDYQRVSALPDMPSLQRGHDYVLFTSAPSAIGLSTTVGLGQGSFRIYEQDHLEMAANELGNAGIFGGPVTYDDLAAAIQAEIGN